jgi:prepilin-type N-terminal cleavage/methylation domain-containing protein
MKIKVTSKALCQQGFTIIEAMISVALLGILASAMMTIVANTMQNTHSTVLVGTEDKIVASIINQIRAAPNQYQVDFSGTSVTPTVFPLGFTDFYYGPMALCPSTGCYGSAAFTVQGDPSFPGLLNIKIWIQNRKVDPLATPKEYFATVTTR